MKRKASTKTPLEDLTHRLIDGFFLSFIAVILLAGSVWFVTNVRMSTDSNRVSNDDPYVEQIMDEYNRALGAAGTQSVSHLDF
jgi:hypothetical protein